VISTAWQPWAPNHSHHYHHQMRCFRPSLGTRVHRSRLFNSPSPLMTSEQRKSELSLYHRLFFDKFLTHSSFQFSEQLLYCLGYSSPNSPFFRKPPPAAVLSRVLYLLPSIHQTGLVKSNTVCKMHAHPNPSSMHSIHGIGSMQYIYYYILDGQKKYQHPPPHF
jgi:hypothetical protein